MPDPMFASSNEPLTMSEKDRSAHAARYVYIGGIDVGKSQAARPDQLRDVDFNAGQNAGDQAGQHDGARYTARGIFGFIGECRNAVESDIGQNRDRRAAQQPDGVECRGIIERMQIRTPRLDAERCRSQFPAAISTSTMTMPSAAAMPALMRAEVSTPLQFSAVKKMREEHG